MEGSRYQFSFPQLAGTEIFLIWESDMDMLENSREAGLINYHAFRLYKCLNSEARVHIDVNDLFQAGLVGLWKAEENYAQKNGASFRTYASIRVRGEMIDVVRKYCPLTKRMVKQKVPFFFTELQEYHHLSYELNTDNIDLYKAIEVVLEEREKRLVLKSLEGYYNKEIGRIEGIGESRVSQIIKIAVEKIKIYNDSVVIPFKPTIN